MAAKAADYEVETEVEECDSDCQSSEANHMVEAEMYETVCSTAVKRKPRLASKAKAVGKIYFDSNGSGGFHYFPFSAWSREEQMC